MHLLLPFLIACGGTEPDEPTGPDLSDPIYDPATWPVEVGSAERPADVLWPSDYPRGERLPVIVLLHGFGVNGELQDFVYQLTARVDRYGFVLLLPDGTQNTGFERFWNATPQCCDFEGSGVDDVGYLDGLLDELEASMPIDAERIYVTGHSNGGYMSYRMACDRSERIAAIAPLAGSNFRTPEECGATRAVPVLHTHGTADPDVTFDDDGWSLGAEKSIAFWTELAGCGPGTTDGGRRDYDVIVAGEETSVTVYDDGCEPGFAAELWAMEGVGHIPGFNDAWRDDLVEWLLARRL